jgi:hypothetical protein
MHQQVEQVLNGPTYVTILSSQEKQNPKIGQALIIITSKTHDITQTITARSQIWP